MNEEYKELCLKDREVIDYIIYEFRKVDIEFDKRFNLEQENKELKDNWNKLKEWLEETINKNKKLDLPDRYEMYVLGKVIDKMQEIEGGMNE